MEHDYSTPSIMEKKILKGIPLEELDISSINEKDDLMIEDLGRSLSGILHVCDSYQMVCASNPTINQVVSCSLDEMDKTYLDEYISEDINKEGTVQWIEQTTPKLVSAMKGGRAQEGKPLKSKLSVKWAPEVYDPPATSESHTVKGHIRRPKAFKKDHHKQKHGKSKSYKGSSADRKHVSRKSTSTMIDSRIFRLEALRARAALNSPCQSKVEAMDFSGVTGELKCGNSYCNNSLAAVHLPVTRAIEEKLMNGATSSLLREKPISGVLC
ncbi:F-Box protein [Musa troglodytarum]|nr:F-Box protein [Musa troglodytarum]